MRGIAYPKKNRSQPGFTLIEILVAIFIAALLLVGSVALTNYMTIAVGKQSDMVLARQQLQYVSFWIGEDVVQAKNVSLSDSKVGDLFSLTGKDQGNETYTVTYSVDVNMKDKLGRDLASLSRTKIGGDGAGTSIVAQYLDPSSTICEYKKQSGNGTVLILSVTAVVDQQAASGTFEINPRAGNITLVAG
jgi:prepilin-type N-terminal cleavage/methylation domain-containing protein